MHDSFEAVVQATAIIVHVPILSGAVGRGPTLGRGTAAGATHHDAEEGTVCAYLCSTQCMSIDYSSHCFGTL